MCDSLVAWQQPAAICSREWWMKRLHAVTKIVLISYTTRHHQLCSSIRMRAFSSCQKKCSRSNSRTRVIFAISYFLIGGSVFSATGSQTIQKCLHSDCHPSESTITSKIFPFLKWFQTLPIITSVVIPFDKLMRHFRQRMGRAWLRRSRNWSCKNNHKKYNLSTRNKLCVGGCSKSHTKIQKLSTARGGWHKIKNRHSLLLCISYSGGCAELLGFYLCSLKLKFVHFLHTKLSMTKFEILLFKGGAVHRFRGTGGCAEEEWFGAANREYI